MAHRGGFGGEGAGSASNSSLSKPPPRSWAALFFSSRLCHLQNLVVSQEKYKTDLFTKAVSSWGATNWRCAWGASTPWRRIARDSERTTGPSWRSSPPMSGSTPPGRPRKPPPEAVDPNLRTPNPGAWRHLRHTSMPISSHSHRHRPTEDRSSGTPPGLAPHRPAESPPRLCAPGEGHPDPGEFAPG